MFKLNLAADKVVTGVSTLQIQYSICMLNNSVIILILSGAKKSRKTKSRMKSKDSCKDSNPDEESQEMEVENQELDESPDKAHVSMETDDEQLAMDFMSDENKPLKSHKVKSHGDVKTKRARSTTVAVAEQSNVKGSHEELKESPDKGQGDGQGEGYDESEEPDEAMEDDASDDDTWSVRKKDSERKLEAMQEKVRLLMLNYYYIGLVLSSSRVLSVLYVFAVYCDLQCFLFICHILCIG